VVESLPQGQRAAGRVHGEQVPVLGGRAAGQRVDDVGVTTAVGVAGVHGEQVGVDREVFTHRSVVDGAVEYWSVVVGVL